MTTQEAAKKSEKANPGNELMDAQLLEKRIPKVDDRFLKVIDGKDFIIYAGLLDLAHQKNLSSLEVEILQYPSKENDHTAVCKAVAKTAAGESFVDIGDANPGNCNSKVAKHIIRMASTRAKARCLRDLTNIGITCLEELGDLNEVMGEENNVTGAARVGKGNVKRFPGKRGNAGQAETTSGAEAQASHINPGSQLPAQQSENVGTAETSTADQSGRAKPTKTTSSGKSGSGNGNGTSKASQGNTPQMSEAQKNAILNLARRRGMSNGDVENMAVKNFQLSLENLTSSDASALIRTLQQSA